MENQNLREITSLVNVQTLDKVVVKIVFFIIVCLRAAVCKYRPGVGKMKISKNPKKIQWTTLGTLVMKI